MKLLKNLLLSALPLTLAVGIGCTDEAAGPDADPCSSGRCDDLDLPDSKIDESPCDGILIDASGRPENARVAGRLNDPLANFAFKVGEDCPTNFADIMAKLRVNDTEGCPDEESGILTRATSESAQPEDHATKFRLVTSRRCGGRDKHELLFSLFNVPAEAESLPGVVEIMAFDETAGVFNYYKTAGDTISYFGNSQDMIDGVKGVKPDCAACHTGGGLIMKELDTPWLHWGSSHMAMPGADDLIKAHANLGSPASGAEFEGVVEAGNRVWNQSRIKTARESSSLKEALRPLFCTVEVNLDNGADFPSPVEGGPGGDEMDSIPMDSLLDPHLKSGGRISIDFADYDAAIGPVENGGTGQRIQGIPGAIDTVFDYAFIEKGFADNNYNDNLANGLVDSEFVKDVLMVDFTRPIFSEDRCALLEFAPILAAVDQDAESIRDGFLATLGNPPAGTPAAELKNNLLTDGGHDVPVNNFIQECTDLGSATLIQNALRITSMNRNTAANLAVFEEPETMPIDTLVHDRDNRLSPVDCSVTTEFVAVTAEVENTTPEPEPEPELECPHDICEEGEALTTSNCNDSCAADICEADSFCCNNNWDDVCVDLVQSVCMQECS